ncbi:hypothetical protein [Methanosarcina vacuolata]|uniref:Uncharacterized protein n=1 Tax=Methanosarcina vacuolata Z-761 TaxID=1434123 RepID=A0A0E3Q7C2_9EURY|nr:hypothetical protein [Methanosarcina vacuolata]AKB44722.1 hypothetical protein MSVAZ_2453 [Methanosarcina vacuolata Z-761]
MSEECLLVLKESFYDELSKKISSTAKVHKDSIFLTLLRERKNNVMQNLDNSAVFSENADPQIINELIERGFIRCGNDLSKYVMTAKGVWEVERRLDKISLTKLMDDIDEYKYDISWGEKLTDKEKVVILSLIALRSFHEKTPLNRKNGKKAIQNIHEIILKTIEFLNNSIEGFKYSIPDETRESPVNSVFARLVNLPQNTRRIYKFNEKEGKSWLDIYDEEKGMISEEKLSYLLWKVFGGNLSFEDQTKIDSFCNNILYTHKNYVYSLEELTNFIFADICYQNAISNSLFKIAENSALWEELDKAKKKK